MRVDVSRVLVFLAFAFGIAWAVGLFIALTGGLVNSPLVFPGLALTRALLLLSTGYMCAPALAHVLTRLATREGWAGTHLWPRLRHGWPFWLIAWIAPAILRVLGMALFFAVFPQYYDAGLGTVRRLLAARGISMDPRTFIATQVISAVVISPVTNGLFTFGEEFGWRAYLLPKLMPLGWRRATLLVGIIWGVWHWPVIAMGYEYGFGYPGFPWLGFLTFLWLTVPMSVFLGWVALRGKSVWPAVIGHGALNGLAGLGALLVLGRPSPMLGPGVVGIVGGLPIMLFGLWLWLRPGPVGEPAMAGPQAA